MDSGFRMALLFLALVPSGHAKRVKTRLQEHAIIYVMKTEVMRFFFSFFYFKKVKKNKLMVKSEETLLVKTPIKCNVMHVGMTNGH